MKFWTAILIFTGIFTSYFINDLSFVIGVSALCICMWLDIGGKVK